MSTTHNIRIIGEENKASKPLKPIQLCKKWANESSISNTMNKAGEHSNIELICKNYFQDYDLIFCYDKERSDGIIYIGHWNDGVVE